ncbi:MAG: IS110 family transposase [Geminicoccaceae bacterium]
MTIATVGLDLAKNVFQVHAVDGAGRVLARKALRRGQVLPFFAKLAPCLVGMEACGTSHYWGRQLSELGHEVRLMSPAYVKPYVKRGKTDAGDAEAICEAVTRPTMRFVPVKSPDQQAALAMHRARDLMVRQRTQLVNMIRGLLGEFGITINRGLHHALELVTRITRGAAIEVPALAARVVTALAAQVMELQGRLTSLERELLAWFRQNDVARRLETIPGIGVVVATAFAATVTDPQRFRSGRQFAAWLGLTPLANSSGGKERMGRISKMGDPYLRRLMVVGATSRVRVARRTPERERPLAELLQRKPARVATVAVANRTARIVWALMARGGVYRSSAAVASASP